MGSRNLWSWTAGTNALYQPIRGEADISPDHVRHEIESTSTVRSMRKTMREEKIVAKYPKSNFPPF